MPSSDRRTTKAPAQLRSPITAQAGVGLRPSHMPEIVARGGRCDSVGWFEIHNENFLSDGGPRRAMLEHIKAHTPISCHGVGLSLGSHDGLDKDHVDRLKRLFAWIGPILISEHLSWSVHGGVYLNDLLPLPYTEETLATVSANVDRAQQAFGRRLLIENPSSYLTFTASQMPEAEFLARLVEQTDCGLLLDVNNIYVSAENNGFDVTDYLEAIPRGAVGEIHLAGHTVQGDGDDRVLVDTHSRRVCEDVWTHYRTALARFGPQPTMIEWDLDLPPLDVLIGEARAAQDILDDIARRTRANVA
ncbi:MAG: DUF692 domain-containing protein [Rhodobacteraceae bacterium]|nr:DUF692 domain-containing protein [Paracoccaceae bacterium]